MKVPALFAVLLPKAFLICIGCLCLASPPARGQVVINEVLAENLSSLELDGSFPDWVELFNTSGSAVDLNDWRLTDNMAQPTKFVFPAGTLIPAGGFLLVYCDGQTNAPGLHASFALNGKGELVALFDGPTPRDVVSFGLQLPDVSIGRSPDGTGPFGPNRPTPLEANQALPVITSTNLKINEWLARPPGNNDDWFELFNPESSIVELGGLVWSDRTQTATNRALAQLSFIAPGGFLQFFADDLDNLDYDHVDFALAGGGDRIILYAADRTTAIDRVDFGNQTNDVSQGRLPDGSTNIVFFGAGRSTPAASNFQLITEVIINEVLTHTDPPLEDAIELHNPTASPVEVSHWWLSNSRDVPQKFRIPAGTVIPAGGLVVFYEYQGLPGGFNPNGAGISPSFTLNSARGDEVFLHTGDAAGNLTFSRVSRSFGPAENGVSFGRYVTSEGKTKFVAMSQRTFGADTPNTLVEFRTGTGSTNALPKVGPVVISEIMYHPPDVVSGLVTNDNSLDEYIELYNGSEQAVPLFDPNSYPYPPFGLAYTNTWRLRGGVDLDFPTNLTLAVGEYLLVVNFSPTNAAQLAAFRTKYNVGQAVKIIGPYRGKLSNNEGSVELHKPDAPQAPGRPDAGLVPYILVEEINYEDDTPWPTEPDGSGLALQRKDLAAFGNDPTNWMAAAASPGTAPRTNAPPVLQPIGDVTTNEFRLVTFTALASDPDDPPQTLTFNLDPGAPTRASITTDGLFRWRPSEAQGPSTNNITVRVTDNGTPNQSATQTFTVIVNEVNSPPIFNIRHKYTKPGATLTFPTAFDHDFPVQALTFSLDPGGPEGLTINTNTGVISWAPTEAQGPPDVGSTNVYSVTVRVSDDWMPPLSATNTYQIYVVHSSVPVVVMDVVSTGESVRISWEATVLKTYQVRYRNAIDAPWSEFWVGVAGQADMFIPDVPAGFYQVLQTD